MEGRAHPARLVHLLTRLVTSLAVVLAAGAPAAVWADDPGNGGAVFDETGDGVGTWVGTPGRPGGPGGGSPARVRRCWLELDAWDNGEPKWPLPGPGGQLNLWFWTVCDGQRGDLALLPVNPATRRPAAATLAEQAYRFLPLPAPQVGFNPPGRAVVGVPTLLWAEPSSWGARTMQVGVTGLSVTVTAVPVSLTWRFGPRLRPLVCPGPGIAYDPSRPQAGSGGRCAYTFRRRPPGGPLPASATTEWHVRWQASDGTSGTLPPLRRTSRFDLPVAEVETVVSRPGSPAQPSRPFPSTSGGAQEP